MLVNMANTTLVTDLLTLIHSFLILLRVCLFVAKVAIYVTRICNPVVFPLPRIFLFRLPLLLPYLGFASIPAALEYSSGCLAFIMRATRPSYISPELIPLAETTITTALLALVNLVHPRPLSKADIPSAPFENENGKQAEVPSASLLSPLSFMANPLSLALAPVSLALSSVSAISNSSLPSAIPPRLISLASAVSSPLGAFVPSCLTPEILKPSLSASAIPHKPMPQEVTVTGNSAKGIQAPRFPLSPASMLSVAQYVLSRA